MKVVAVLLAVGGVLALFGGVLLAGAFGVSHGTRRFVVIVRGDGADGGTPMVHETWVNAAPWAGALLPGNTFEVTHDATVAGERFEGTTAAGRWAFFEQALETVDVSGGPVVPSLTFRERTRAPYAGCAEAVGEGTARARLSRSAGLPCVLFDARADEVEVTFDP